MAFWFTTDTALALIETTQGYGSPLRTFSAILTLHRGFISWVTNES